MTEFTDSELGDITVQRLSRAKKVSIRVSPNGKLRAVAPPYVPVFMIKRLIVSSRSELQKMIARSHPETIYNDGDLIGKSHWLKIQRTESHQLSHRLSGQHLLVTIPAHMPIESPAANRAIKDGVIVALRKQAKSYLPKRISYMAESFGYTYEKVRFSHASSRWGSCSTHGTISLNIALMKLPFELIDYVLIHELCHTKQMNHSASFWQLVEMADANYKEHRRLLKKQTPTI
ncbi:MAG: SprT family zinc-dependent metalloprotease [Candidatus Saccharimonadaceae bacterium]